MKKYILITGASSGIGYSLAKTFLAHDCIVFGSVRNKGDGERLLAEFGEAFVPLYFDVTDPDAITKAVAEVEERIGPAQNISCLINNAGIATFGPLAIQPLDEIKSQLEINIIGPLQVTRAFLPLLGTSASRRAHPGKVINVSSVAGKIGTPFLGAYAASKHAMEGWSESLRRELIMYGIDVIIVGPGSIATPIWEKAEKSGLEKYDGSDYEKGLKRFYQYMIKRGRFGIEADVLAQNIFEIYESSNPKVRYTFAQEYLKNWLIPRFLPKRWMDRLFAKNLHMNRE